VTSVPLAFCFLCSFPFVFFHCLASHSLVISLVRSFPCYIILVNGLLPLSPTFGEGRQTGNGKIVCRHSLDRLNASMIKQKKK